MLPKKLYSRAPWKYAPLDGTVVALSKFDPIELNDVKTVQWRQKRACSGEIELSTLSCSQLFCQSYLKRKIVYARECASFVEVFYRVFSTVLEALRGKTLRTTQKEVSSNNPRRDAVLWEGIDRDPQN